MEVKSTDTQMDGGAIIRAVMALSGGMDSTALLCRLLADGYIVSCISYNYGQKHVIEIDRAKANIEYLAENNLTVEHRIVDLSGVMGIFNSALTNKDIEVPEGHHMTTQVFGDDFRNRIKLWTHLLAGGQIRQVLVPLPSKKQRNSPAAHYPYELQRPQRVMEDASSEL